MAPQVTKNLFGQYKVKYACPHCKSRLASPLNDAGMTDSCPDCGFAFKVPGTEERGRVLAEKQKQANVPRSQRDAMKQAELKELLTKQRRRVEAEQKALQHERITESDTKRCPFCAEDILASAKKCKYCREYLTSETRVIAAAGNKKKKTSKWVWCTVGVLFFAALLNSGKLSQQPAAGLSSSDNYLIIGAAQDGIRRILKSPNTASFPSRTLNQAAYSITPHSSDSCTVTGYVDAENSFGALLRSYWKVDCVRNGRFWCARNPILLGP